MVVTEQHMPKKKQESGGARLVRSGKTPVTVGLTADQHRVLREAAARDNRPLTQFLLHHGLEAAEKILGKTTNGP